MQWIRLAVFVVACAGGGMGCSSPAPRFYFKRFEFPKESALIGTPQDRKFERIGVVRARADYMSLNAEDPNLDGQKLCLNYYNRAVQDLVKFAKAKKADAVIEVKSVVFMLDGKSELHDTPECADDGAEGQSLVQGVAVRWIKDPETAEKRTQ